MFSFEIYTEMIFIKLASGKDKHQAIMFKLNKYLWNSNIPVQLLNKATQA